MKKLFFILLLYIHPAYAEYSSILDSLTIISLNETDDCCITILSNQEKKFVLKQIKKHSPDEQFLLVLDALGATIATSLNLSVNKIDIIPAQIHFFAKQFQQLPATLHTFVPGLSTANSSCKFFNIKVQQKYRNKNAYWLKQYGDLKEEEMGLTPEVIYGMTLHHDLPGIVALDTFIGNADRSCPNLFYDEISDKFYGIDMAGAFNKNLCKIACYRIEQFLNKKYIFTQKEINSFKKYYDILKQLIMLYPPEKTCALFEDLATKAGFSSDSVLWNQDIINRFIFHKRIIYESFSDAQNLIMMLEIFFTKNPLQ